MVDIRRSVNMLDVNNLVRSVYSFLLELNAFSILVSWLYQIFKLKNVNEYEKLGVFDQIAGYDYNE
jgi:hypothetical protein